jgi:hypothetical protein
MTVRPLVVLAMVALLLATGCATVTFKRGAGPGGAKADEDACRASSESQAVYVACLRERGWMVGGQGAEPAPRKAAAPTAGESADPVPQPSAAPAKPSTPAQPAPAGAPAKSKTMTPPAEGPGRAPSGEPETLRPGAGGTPETVPAPPAETKPTKPAPPTRAGYPDADAPAEEAPLDPDTKINVSSWWKLGGTAADLDRAVAACVDELGAAHKPNPGITEVTVALKDCLRAKKWIAVGGTGPL